MDSYLTSAHFCWWGLEQDCDKSITKWDLKVEKNQLQEAFYIHDTQLNALTWVVAAIILMVFSVNWKVLHLYM